MSKSRYFDFTPSAYRDAFDVGLAESIHNYLIHGFQPGGFMTALFANDIFTAVASCHPGNKNSIADIVYWIRWNAPVESWGSYEAVGNWTMDTDNVRTNYVIELEKKLI
jgi:hypothetical protein